MNDMNEILYHLDKITEDLQLEDFNTAKNRLEHMLCVLMIYQRTVESDTISKQLQ